MKIGIDISQIVFEGTGVATYTKNLVENLLKIDPTNTYTLFGTSLRRLQPLRDFTTAPKIILPIPPTLLSLLWNDVHLIPLETFTGKLDVFHTSDWTQPPSKIKKVTTIHDLVVYQAPESSHPQIIATQKKSLDWIKKESDLIIVDSVATMRDCVEILAIPQKKLRVIYLAAGEDFTNFAGQSRSSIEQQINDVKKKYSLDKKYVLTVGTKEPRKNLARLIEAFEKLDQKDVELVMVGKYGWGSEDNNVHSLGFVPQEDLPALYAGAEVFAYPSLYEGFGIPILEAMTVGCPVITSNISSMPEVGGEAAVYVDPKNVSDLSAKLKNVLALTTDDRKQLIVAGHVQAKKFSWEKTARETLAVYKELA